MPKPIFAVGIPIPNGNMEHKSDGLGQTFGIPDGYRASTQFDTDRALGTVLRTYWTGLRRGVYEMPYAAPHASRGKAFSVGLLNTATVTSGRYIETPPTAVGYTWGSSAVNALGLAGDNWWVRLRLWFAGLGLPPNGAASWRLNVNGYVDAAESSFATLATITLDNVNDWIGLGWHQKASTPFQITSNVHHVRVRLIMDRGPASAGYAYGCYTDLTLETLGPIDAAMNAGIGEATGGGPTLAAEGAGGTYYQLTQDFKTRGYRHEPLRFGKSRRMPSGGLRTFDPSGGAMRRRFVLPLDLLPRVDWTKLYRIWLANKGTPQELGADQGMPFPVLFSPQKPDAMGFYYCSFEGEEFPVKEIGAQDWMAGTEAGQLYKGTVVLAEW